jgi:hypothetical protein
MTVECLAKDLRVGDVVITVASFRVIDDPLTVVDITDITEGIDDGIDVPFVKITFLDCEGFSHGPENWPHGTKFEILRRVA